MTVNTGRRQLLSGAGMGAALALAAGQLSSPTAAAARLSVPATAAAVAAGTVHVSPPGNDGNDGLYWATAKLTVSGALAALPAGGIIFLARGVITGCNGTIDLSAMDILAENLLYESSPPAVLENNTGATEHSAIKGSLVRPPVTSVTAGYQATVSDSVIVADAANGGFTVTLPLVAGWWGSSTRSRRPTLRKPRSRWRRMARSKSTAPQPRA